MGDISALFFIVFTIVLTKTFAKPQGRNSIQKCPKGNDSILEDCLQQIIKKLTPIVGPGLKEFDLPPLDPVEIQKFAYDRTMGPMNISVHNRNTVTSGFTKYKIFKLRVDSKNMKMHFMYEVPYISGKTNYQLSGNFLFFPLTGGGPVHFEIFNLKAAGEVLGKLVLNSKGTKIVQVQKIDFQQFSIGDMNLRIRGLFDGNKLLSSAVHYFAKRYASQIFEVAKPEVSGFIGNYIAHDILNPILRKRPYIVDYISN